MHPTTTIETVRATALNPVRKKIITKVFTAMACQSNLNVDQKTLGFPERTRVASATPVSPICWIDPGVSGLMSLVM